MTENSYLSSPVAHFNIKDFDSTPLIDQYRGMSFQARNIARSADIYLTMLMDKDCKIILTLGGSLFSAGLKRIVVDLIKSNLVDMIVATGALIVDQDFFEALGFKHYQKAVQDTDTELFKKGIDRIYDTYISEKDLRNCDFTIAEIADNLKPGPWSSRQFIVEMGAYLVDKQIGEDSLVRQAFEKDIPIFVPAFSDCSAGFGLVYHQWNRPSGSRVTIDSVQDFKELTEAKINVGDTGLVMIGGGVPKNFAQDVVVSAELVNGTASMHKYAIQMTIADERDGALSGSSLKEAHSWGKVKMDAEQMVFCEATIGFPLVASYVYHKMAGIDRQSVCLNRIFSQPKPVEV